MSSPLNPAMFSRLEALFGSVIITSAGAAQIGHVKFTATLGRKWIVSDFGEYYSVRCPYCQQSGNGPDGGNHLWINHAWGVREPQSGDERWWQAHCFRSNCMSAERDALGFENRRDLRRRVFDPLGGVGRLPQLILTGRVREPDPVVILPGECVLIDRLPPDHPASIYLEQRGFDRQMLAGWWRVCYCTSCGENPYAAGRIILPIYDRRGQLAAWQGRVVGDPIGPPKYYNAARLHPRRHLYGTWHVLPTAPYVLIVEGPTDVWRFGPGAVGLLGSQATSEQVEAIRLLTFPLGRPALIALDGRTFRADGTVKSDTTDAAQELRRVLTRLGCLAAVLPLADGYDPDTLGYQAMRWVADGALAGFRRVWGRPQDS